MVYDSSDSRRAPAGSSGPSAEDEEVRAFRQAVRAFARTHHPDLGGDPEVFIAGLRRLRAQHPRAARLTAAEAADLTLGQRDADGASVPPAASGQAVRVTAYRRAPLPARLVRGLVRRWERQRRPRVR